MKIDWRKVLITLAIVALVVVLSVLRYPAGWEWLHDVLVYAGLAFVGVAGVWAILPMFVHRNDPPLSPQKTAPGDEVGGDKIGKVSVAGSTGAAIGTNASATVNINNYDQRVMPALPDARFSIPPPSADFTGRAEDIGALLADVRKAGGANISGLVGFGGIGKTALALKVAETLKGEYPDAQILVDLQGTKTPLTAAQAMGRVVRAFVAAEAKLPENPEEMAALYRTVVHEKKMLLLLDDAHDAGQIRALLPLTGCAVLVTSRMHFVVPGLTPIRLDVLNEEDARALLVRICPRIGDAAEQLAELCGRLPLALEIAGSFLAARVDVDAAEYGARLRARRIGTLKAADDAELDLERVFGESYDQLGEKLQRWWRMLGVFPASFTAEAAMAVWGDGEAEEGKDALGELARFSLLEFRDGRYQMHDLLREYALGKMSEEEKWDAQKRHAEFYKNVASVADDMYLKGGDKVVVGLRLFDQELTHIRAGQKWAAGNVESDTDAVESCNEYPNATNYVRHLRLSARENIQWLEDALRAARKLENRKYEGMHLGNLGLAYAALGEVRRAIEYHEQALVIDREIGDRRGEGADLGNLGLAYADLGEVRRAIEYQEQRLVIVREIGDRRGEGQALGNLGVAYKNLGEVRRGIEYYEQALVIAREIGDRRGEGNALGNLGLAYADLGEVRRAIEYYEQALVIAREIGDRRGEGNSLGSLGLAYADLGEVRRAIEYHEQALKVMQEIGDKRAEGSILGNLGNAYADLGEVRRAIEYYEQHLVIAREIGDRRGEGNALANMGMAYKGLDEPQRARELWQAALEIYEAIEDPNAGKVRKLLEEFKG